MKKKALYLLMVFFILYNFVGCNGNKNELENLLKKSGLQLKDAYEIYNMEEVEQRESYVLKNKENSLKLEFEMYNFEKDGDLSESYIIDYLYNSFDNINSIYVYLDGSTESKLYEINMEDKNLYLVKNNKHYWLKCNDFIAFDVFGNMYDISHKIFEKEIIVGENKKIRLKCSNYIQDGKMLYEIQEKEGDNIVFFDGTYQNNSGKGNFSISKGNFNFEIEHYSPFFDEAVQFIDINLDGNFDLKVPLNIGATNCECVVFVWNENISEFSRISCSEMINYLEMEEGKILNYQKNDVGYIVQEFVLDSKNKELILISEKLITPDS